MLGTSGTGSIYCATCGPTGLRYIGQTRDHKIKNGKPYVYGIKGRWNDHVSTVSSTPLHLAIQTHGSGAFTLTSIESGVPEERLDEREAHWIAELNTVVPNGYNKMRHGRCRHRESSSLSAFYAPITESVRVTQIERNGVPHLIHVYLQLKESGESARLVFGQGKGSRFADALSEVLEFLSVFDCPIEMDPRIINPTASEYETKLQRFDGVNISKIRVAKFNNLAAVYIDKERICFGGKTITFEQAVEKARTFAHALIQKHTEATYIDSSSKSATGGCLSS